MRWTAWILVAALWLAFADRASAQPPPQASQAGPPPFPKAVLDYRVEAGLPCPTAEELRAAVAKEMEFDALDQDAPGVPVGRFRVTVFREPPKLVIRVSFSDPKGKPVSSTEFEGSAMTERTCSHLVKRHAMAEIVMELFLAWSRILGPPRSAAHPPPAPTPPPAPPAPSCQEQPAPSPGTTPPPCHESPYSIWPEEWPMPPLPRPVPDPPKPLERWPIAVRLGVAAWPELVASGWGSLGFSADAGVRYRWASLAVEADVNPPFTATVFQNIGTVSFARVSGSLLLCAHFGWFVGCGVDDVGRFIFPNHVEQLPAWARYNAAGARAALEFPIMPPWLFLRAGLDVRSPIHPASFMVRGTDVFNAAGPSVSLGIGLGAELPL